MVCRWQCEIDQFCLKVLAKHWPKVKRYKDVRKVGKHNLEPVDLICGGVPCQAASVAGLRRGSQDDRWLWPEALRIVREFRPRWVIFENVYGFITLNDGMEFDKVLSDLEAEGYETQTFIIPACAVDAPHRRDRVWIVAHSAEQRKRRRRIQRSDKNCTTTKKRTSDKFTGSSKNATDTKCIHDDSTRHGTSKDGRQQSRQTEVLRNGCKWLPEPPVGRVVAGFSAELDGDRIRDEDLQNLRFKEEFTDERWNMGSHWIQEPNISRITKGTKNRVNRLRALGNAVVPQIVEIIGRAIVEAEKNREK